MTTSYSNYRGIFKFRKSSSNNQKVCAPKLRFPGFDEPWNTIKLSDFAVRVTRKNTGNETNLPLTISSKDGLVDQINYFNKTVASKDMRGYYLLQNGEFAYNKSYSVGYDFGSIKRLDRYTMGALSTLYICFALKKFDSDFIKAYFDSLKWYREIYMISAEGARNHGLLNVPTEEFFETKHYLPNNSLEQKKIAEFLISLDRRIEAQQSLVNNLKKYKRGLLRSYFITDKWNKHSTWDACKLGELCSKIGSGKTPRGGASVYVKDGIMLLRSQNVLWGALEISDVSYIDETINSTMLSSEVKNGDVLLNITGASIGRSCIYSLNKRANVNQHVCIIRLSLSGYQRILPEFLLQQILSDRIQQQIVDCQNGGSRKGLNFQQISDFYVVLPSIAEQKEVCSMLSALDKRVFLEENIHQYLTRQRFSFMQQLFI